MAQSTYTVWTLRPEAPKAHSFFFLFFFFFFKACPSTAYQKNDADALSLAGRWKREREREEKGEKGREDSIKCKRGKSQHHPSSPLGLLPLNPSSESLGASYRHLMRKWVNFTTLSLMLPLPLKKNLCYMRVLQRTEKKNGADTTHDRNPPSSPSKAFAIYM